jgi:hypothetical protein
MMKGDKNGRKQSSQSVVVIYVATAESVGTRALLFPSWGTLDSGVER